MQVKTCWEKQQQAANDKWQITNSFATSVLATWFSSHKLLVFTVDSSRSWIKHERLFLFLEIRSIWSDVPNRPLPLWIFAKICVSSKCSSPHPIWGDRADSPEFTLLQHLTSGSVCCSPHFSSDLDTQKNPWLSLSAQPHHLPWPFQMTSANNQRKQKTGEKTSALDPPMKSTGTSRSSDQCSCTSSASQLLQHRLTSPNVICVSVLCAFDGIWSKSRQEEKKHV